MTRIIISSSCSGRKQGDDDFYGDYERDDDDEDEYEYVRKTRAVAVPERYKRWMKL